MRPEKRGKDQPSRVSQKGKENNEEKKLRKIHDSNTVWKLSSQLLINFEQESLENVLEAWNGSRTTSAWS